LERTVLDEQGIVRRLRRRARDALSVFRSEDQGTQNQQVQRALQQIESFLVVLGRHVT
jgi:hypothetical protein